MSLKLRKPLFIVMAALAAFASLQIGPVNRALADNATPEPVTLYLTDQDLALTLDPQIAEDNISVGTIENLFLGLTDFDPKTSQIRPEIASEWTHKPDANGGTVWIFTLKNDIPWVRWDPATKKATEIRKVTAQDFVYGIKRSCDPRLGAYYTKIAATLIKGCDIVASIKPDAIKASDFDQIGVTALSDTQLQIATQNDVSYFLYTTSMWMFRAVPQEAIDEFGINWTLPGNIITDGPFVVDTFFPDAKAVYLRNPLYPNDVNDSYGGNVERVNQLVVGTSTEYELYKANQTDYAQYAFYLTALVKNDPVLSKQIVHSNIHAVEYLGFMYDQPPFDKAEVRRAFSAAIDRKAFTDKFTGIPIAHLIPPGIVGAVGLNEIGVGFDPAYAKQQLAAAGYPDCKGFPQVNLLDTGTETALFIQSAIKENLGCSTGLINIRTTSFYGLLQDIKPNAGEVRPHMFLLGWAADYPDAQNWMHDLLGCNAENDLKRPCSALDKQIDIAAVEQDTAKRQQMYRHLETELFGKDGEFPLAPIDIFGQEALAKPWLTAFFETDGVFGGSHWDSYRIDQAAQFAARSGAQVE